MLHALPLHELEWYGMALVGLFSCYLIGSKQSVTSGIGHVKTCESDEG